MSLFCSKLSKGSHFHVAAKVLTITCPITAGHPYPLYSARDTQKRASLLSLKEPSMYSPQGLCNFPEPVFCKSRVGDKVCLQCCGLCGKKAGVTRGVSQRKKADISMRDGLHHLCGRQVLNPMGPFL